MGKWESHKEFKLSCLCRPLWIFIWKKKRGVGGGVRSALAFWPDKAPFCGIFNEEYWPGASFWRQGGTVLEGDSTCRIFQMVSTISSINSGSGLQLQEHPQLFIYFFYKKNTAEVSDHKIKINELRKMEWNAKIHFLFTLGNKISKLFIVSFIIL